MGSKSTPDRWPLAQLSEVITNFASGGTPSTDVEDYWDGDIPWITSADIVDGKVDIIRKFISKDGVRNSATTIVGKGDLLVVTRVAVGKLAIAPFDVAISQDTTGVTPDRRVISPEYLYYALRSGMNRLIRYNQGTSISGVTRKDLQRLHIPLPPLTEQRKIAAILSTWDRAIELVGKQIEGKQRLKRALLQRLLTGRVRFSGFGDEWKIFRLGEFLTLKLRKVEKPDKEYLRLGVRSHGKGTFTTTVDDPETVDMTHLYQVKPGDLIVSITFAWEGAIAIVEEDGDGGLVSHRFPTFILDTETVVLEFFRYLMVSPRFFYDLRGVSPGGAGRNRVMSKREFLNILVNVPSVGEQKKIGSLLRTIDKDLATLIRLQEKLRTQKQGLMQRLLTGEVRVSGGSNV